MQRYAWAYTQTAVLFAALDLDLLTCVAGGADTEARLVEAMGIGTLNVMSLANLSHIS